MKKLKSFIFQMLRRSERFTKTDMVYLTKGGFWLSLTQGIASVTGLVLAIAFANFLPPEVYGNYRYILSVMGILAVTSLTGINLAYIQAVARGFEGSFARAFKTKFRFSLLGSLGGLALAFYYQTYNNTELAIGFFVVAIFFPIFQTSGLFDSILHGQKDFRRSAIYNGLVRIISVGALIGALFITDNLAIILIAFFLPEIVLHLIITFIVLRRMPIQPASDPTVNKFGIHLSLMEVLKTVAGQIDKILVFHYLGAIELALYSFALAVPSQLKGLLQNLKSLALPKFSAAKSEDLYDSLPKKIRRFEIFVVAAVVVYIFTAPSIYKIFFPKYLEAVLLSQIYALAIVFLPRTLYSTALIAKRKQKELYEIRILTPIIKIIILFVAVINWGLWGVIGARVVGEALLYFIYNRAFRKAFAKS